MTVDEPTPLEKKCVRALKNTRDKMMRERFAIKRPRPRWLGPGGSQEQEDLAQVRAVLRIVSTTKEETP